MRTSKKIAYLFIFIFIAISCKKEKKEDIPAEEIIPSECTIPLANDAYKYPIVPGDAKWAELQTGKAMDSVLLIPNSILSTISTDGLVETCLNYPLFWEFSLSNWGIQQSFNNMVERFNGYQELYRRDLVGENLLQRYKQMKATCLVNNYPICFKDDLEMAFDGIEMLLAQDTILRQFDKSQLLELNNEALIKYEEKLTLPKVHSEISRSMTALVIGRILKKEKYPPFIVKLKNDAKINGFIDDVPYFTNPDMLDTIVNYGNAFSNSKK